jgi:hypothetical protein
VGVLGALQAGGQADSHFKWLYPYDLTVFPRGLLPPRAQWSGTQPQWLLVTASSLNLVYTGVFAPTNEDQLPGTPSQLDLPADAWTAITGAGANDPVTIQVTKYDVQSAVTGPIAETWTIAQGTLKGIVYYNSYDSPLAQGDSGSANDQGAVMRLRPGDTQPEVFIGGSQKGSCTVCHTLSANGSTMALSAGHVYDAVYGVTADASSPVGPLSTQPDNVYSFGALTPDGKYLFSCGSTGLDAGDDNDGGPVSYADYGPNVVSMTHELNSQLFATADGGVVGAMANVPKALMPAFSPDGTALVFNRFVAGQDQRLAVASFNEATLTFGAPVDIFVDPGYYLAWPTFLPDSRSFVFETTEDSDQYSTYEPVSYEDADGELFQYVPSVNDVHHLRAAMGQEVVTTDGGQELVTYLLNPDGTVADQDGYKNYQPTALPVAAGGYYWVVFTSRRSYGNTIDNSNPNDTPPNVKPKKLWVAALDIDGNPENDPSHPAFYLPGQELGAGNIRGFWTLPPCEANGASCQSGTDCCTGFCRQVTTEDGGTAVVTDSGVAAFTCISPPPACSNVDEKCTVDSDCCGTPANGVHCLAGFCAIPTPK